MKNILILGHKGMLGNAVYKYLATKKDNYSLMTLSERWDTSTFRESELLREADIIINCIGLIPQKKPLPEEYKKINIDLPVFLESLGKKIIHPSTDCEFIGNISVQDLYTKESIRDADDAYGKSKADISKRIEETFKNTKIIRTSIIGHEEKTNLSLLDWFLSSENSVNGYSNHYWNGITTLEWAKQCEELITNWDAFSILTQYGTSPIRSKYDLLQDIKKVYKKNIEIQPFETPTLVNKCLKSDKELRSMTEQLIDLKAFYGK